MANLFIAADRASFQDRLRHLTSEAPAQWGALTAAQMLTHLIDAFQITFAEKEVKVRRGFLATAFGRWLMLKLPIPRGRITAPPIFHETEPGDFSADRDQVIAYINRFADGPDQRFGPSPLFGHMSPQQWAGLHATHLEHHLTQFGV